jgi:hypothetical protein
MPAIPRRGADVIDLQQVAGGLLLEPLPCIAAVDARAASELGRRRGATVVQRPVESQAVTDAHGHEVENPQRRRRQPRRGPPGSSRPSLEPPQPSRVAFMKPELAGARRPPPSLEHRSSLSGPPRSMRPLPMWAAHGIPYAAAPGSSEPVGCIPAVLRYVPRLPYPPGSYPSGIEGLRARKWRVLARQGPS